MTDPGWGMLISTDAVLLIPVTHACLARTLRRPWPALKPTQPLRIGHGLATLVKGRADRTVLNTCGSSIPRADEWNHNSVADLRLAYTFLPIELHI